MSEKVACRARRGKHRKTDRLSGAERRELLLERQAAWMQEWAAVATAFIESRLKAEVQEIIDRPARKWGDRAEEIEARASCNKCQRKWRSWFRRNGSYPRTLAIDGIVIDLRVPRLRCACGGTVDLSFGVFAPYERVSLELAERLREGVALGLTLRQVGEVTAPANGGPLAKSTINRRVLEVSRLATAFRQGALESVPPVVLLDGIWLKVLEPTGERFTDVTGRDRQRMRRKKVGLLVAYGVDPTTGQWWVLDWERAEQEDQESWGRLLERLRQRGVNTNKGLKLIVSDGSEGLRAALGLVDMGVGVKHQLCVFHRLRNIGKAVKGLLAGRDEMNKKTRETKEDREARRERRRVVVKEAAAIYKGTDRPEILRRKDAFVTRWQESEPDAVATLLRDFPQTIAYLEVQEAAAGRGEHWDARYLRTTSALERLNRRLRYMIRQVLILHSDAGLQARVYMTLLQAGEFLIPRGSDWLEFIENNLAVA